MATEKKDKAADKAALSKTVKIKALLPLAGKFLLSADPGTELELDEKQAKEIVEAGYAEYVK